LEEEDNFYRWREGWANLSYTLILLQEVTWQGVVVFSSVLYRVARVI
jgi:hypothetical protein